MDTFEQLNRIPRETNTTDFRIDSYNGENLLITGSFDFCYYHEIEVDFKEVEYVNLPASFFNPKFSMANLAEQKIVRVQAGLDNAITIYKIEAETGLSEGSLSFYVAAMQVEIREGTVYYYERDNLKEGERIAHWVKRSS